MQLRQVALVAEDLNQVRQLFFTLLGLVDDYDDPGVGAFGLRNSVMVIGSTFLEVVSPKEPGTTAGRLLERRGGDGGYMVIAQVDEFAPVSARIDELGLRRVWDIDQETVSACHVHPKDIGAAIVSFDEMRPAEEWLWAGPGWRERSARHVSRLSAVEVQGSDPEALASRWSAMFQHPFRLEGDALVMPLDEGEVRFIEARDGRGDGVSAVEFEVSDRAALDGAVEKLGLSWTGSELLLCGTRLQFREPA